MPSFPLGMRIRNTEIGVSAVVVGHAMVVLPAIASDYTLPYKVVLVILEQPYSGLVVGWPEDEVVSIDFADRLELSAENNVYKSFREKALRDITGLSDD